jgi:hypothetical protein
MRGSEVKSVRLAARDGAEGRRAVLAELMVRKERYDRVELGVEFGVSAATIRRDEEMIRAEWREERLAAAEVMLAQDLAELGMVKREAWRVYEASLEPVVSETRQATNSSGGGLVEGGDGPGPKLVETTGRTVTTPRASLGALQLVMKCLEDRRRLLGYGADEAAAKKPRVFAFTVKIGDKVIQSESCDGGELEGVDDAEFYEVQPDGSKALLGPGRDDDGGEVQ